MRTSVVASVCLALSLCDVGAQSGERGASGELIGVAVLPAQTFGAGPAVGAFFDNGRRAEPRWPSPPVQGVSSIWPSRDGWWWALSDNGFGTRLNSSDVPLRIYRLRPIWRTSAGAPMDVSVDSAAIQLRDPNRLVPFRIAEQGSDARTLTGGDFDPESLVVAADGSFWIGDEFGPFLLHVSPAGELLEPPIELPGVRSPDHPLLAPADARQASVATAGRSRGFEGLGSSPDGARLYGALEAGIAGGASGTTSIHEFDVAMRRWTGRTWTYRLDEGAVGLTELACYAQARCLSIERDNAQGDAARVKRVYAVVLGDENEARKTLVLDLLDIADPQGLAGAPGRFRFPYITTEAVWAEDDRTLVLVNDNNFPATGGRGEGVADATEFIRVRLAAPLP